MLKTELKPEIFEDVVDSIMQTEEWLQIEMNDPRINEAENAVMALLDGIKEQIPDDYLQSAYGRNMGTCCCYC